MGAQATSPDHYPPAAKPLNFLYASVSLHNKVFLLMYQCIMSHNFPLHMAVVILPLLDWLPGDRGMSPLWGRIVSTRRMGGAPMIGLGGAHWIASSVKDRASLLVLPMDWWSPVSCRSSAMRSRLGWSGAASVHAVSTALCLGGHHQDISRNHFYLPTSNYHFHLGCRAP